MTPPRAEQVEQVEQVERPKRLSLSQIVELLLTRPTRGASSVSLGRNASGEVVIDVTTQAADGETVEDAERRCREVYDRLDADYARKNGEHENAEITLTRNAKGETQISMSAKTSPGKLATLAALEAEARNVYDRTRMKYPMQDGYSARPGSVG